MHMISKDSKERKGLMSEAISNPMIAVKELKRLVVRASIPANSMERTINKPKHLEFAKPHWNYDCKCFGQMRPKLNVLAVHIIDTFGRKMECIQG